MCVIAFSPKGNDMPTEEDIRKMFSKNDDGAGYAWEEGDTVKFKKGFMNVDDLLEDLGPLSRWKDKNIAMHFRIGTAGKNDKKTTHPFPISNNFGELRKLQGEGPVLFHNGVISGLGGIIDPLASDTQDFVAGVASKLLTRPNKPTKVTEAVVESVIGSSRLLLMYGKGRIVKFGDWKEKDGNQYSNLLWDTTTTTYKPTTNYSSWYGSSSYYSDGSEFEYEEGEHIWPSSYHQWFGTTKERGKQIYDNSYVGEDNYYHFNACPSLQWETTTDFTQWWTTEAQKHMYEDENKLYEWDEYHYFETEEEYEEWKETAIELSDGTFEKDGKIWYVDKVNLEIFTDLAIDDLTECTDTVKALEFVKKYGYIPQDDFELEERMEEEEVCPASVSNT